jgi:hypothetical protein
MKRLVVTALSLGLIVSLIGIAVAWTPVAVEDDPLVRMPGTQPGQVNLEGPGRCLNCHAGYDSAVEPGFNWKGSMMAQSARDFLFWSCLTVAAQDSIWAVGRPNAVDICERCHFPKGWLEGRSDPTNASAMIGDDFDGVQCDFCHTMWDPFFETTFNGTREGDDWLGYWDETNVSSTPSQPAADATYSEDAGLSQAITFFNLGGFFTGNVPPANYVENGAGQYFISSGSQKRASFADAAARHQMFYSRYHKSKYFCDTCHDVSNPALANFLNPGDPLHTEKNSAFSYFHVERTFSEFMLSVYGQPGGAETNPEFQAQGAPDITHASKCQDCHMRDVVGVGCNKQGVPVRPNESVEHPQSGQPVHDMTGGNAWVSAVLASVDPANPNMDQDNYDLLVNQVNGLLTLDVNHGQGLDYQALLAGVDRVKQQLLLAATIKNVTYNTSTGALSFQVQNNSAHKLISGFPEGRRMFVNIKAYAGGSLKYEVNPYDAAAGTLKGLDYPYLGMGLPDPQPLDLNNEIYVDELVYEMHPESALTGESESFHFALATGRHKDNRIPPKGFDIAKAGARLSVPVWHGVEVPNYFTTTEYTNGYDEVSLNIPEMAGADYVEVNLYYQTTSREYIEFLRDEIRGVVNLTLYGPDNPNDTRPTYASQNGLTPDDDNAYIVHDQNHVQAPFFDGLRAWGDTIWNLWVHNMNVDGAKPFLMTQATYGTGTSPEPPCSLEMPSLDVATPGHTQVTLEWSAVSAATGYNVYYDQGGKAQLVANIDNTTYIDAGLTNGVEYCYKVTAYDASCESGFSNILCAIPENQGQTTDPAGVSTMETGIYTGKGNAKTFQAQTAFNAGDGVTIRTYVVDHTTGLPLAGATVDLLITGPETLTLVTGPSDANGMAEAIWQTKAAGKRTSGTTPGDYTAQTKNVTATGYHWDGVITSTSFIIQQ